METEKPAIAKMSWIRRLSYGLCGACGPKVEITAIANDPHPSSRPSQGPPTNSGGGKKRNKVPTNVTVGAQVPNSEMQSPRSPYEFDFQQPLGDVMPSGQWPSTTPGSTGPCPDMMYSENPPYEIGPPTNNFSGHWGHHPHQATGTTGQIPWQSQPKDDGSILRLFRNVDGRITDHILNYYIAQDGVPYQDYLGDIPDDDRVFLENIAKGGNWSNLLSKQESRISLLRAIISARVLRDPGAFQASSFYPPSNNYIGPDNVIYQITKTICDLIRPFALKGSNDDARFHSMRALVFAAAELHSTISAQPGACTFEWQDDNELDTRKMEPVLHPRQASGRVRTTVFPGLLKRSDTGLSLLARAQVLLY